MRECPCSSPNFTLWNYPMHKDIGNPTGAQNNQKVGGREGDYPADKGEIWRVPFL